MVERSRRNAGRSLTLVLLALGILALPAAPAIALDVDVESSRRLLGGLEQGRFTVRLDDGIARGDFLRFAEDDPNVDLRPRLAQRQVHGVQQLTRMASQELGRGAVAGINGGYWINRRSGNPNGLHVQDGRLLGSNASAWGGGERQRSALGIGDSGRLWLDRVQTEMTLRLPGDHDVRIRYANRRVHTGSDSVVYTDDYGDALKAPAGSVMLVTEGLRPRSGGGTTGTVTHVYRPESDRYLTLQAGQTGIVLNRSAAGIEAARSLRRGDDVAISTRVTTVAGGQVWPKDLDGALPAGGTLLRDGRIPGLSEWISEAFSRVHFAGRDPRTAIGRTRDGEALLVTVDKRPGWSTGVTGRELAELLGELGAVDAVNLDGGGSTMMTVGGEVRNRPEESSRRIASGLFVYAPTPPAPRDLSRHACPEGAAPADTFGDVGAGSVHATAVDCLAWWEVTEGKRPGTYAPSEPVSRGQMASFIARWVDGAAHRGALRELPRTGSTRFGDVPPSHTHAEAISRLADAGIAEGRSSDRFAPAESVTRAQMASFIRRALEYATGVELPGRDTFIDDNGSTHEGAIDRLAGIQVASGKGGFDYRPQSSIARDAMASLLMRAADHLVETGATEPPA